jgi:hypothetical protein
LLIFSAPTSASFLSMATTVDMPGHCFVTCWVHRSPIFRN